MLGLDNVMMNFGTDRRRFLMTALVSAASPNLVDTGFEDFRSKTQHTARTVTADELSLEADPSHAGVGKDSSSYLQNLLNEAHQAAIRNGVRCRVIIRNYFCGSEMLIVPNLVDIEMSRGGAYDVSRANMMSGFLAIQTIGTKMYNIRVVGSGRGVQPINKEGLVAADVRLSGCGVIFAGVLGGVIKNGIFEDCGGVSGVAPFNGVAGIWLTHGTRQAVVVGNTVRRCRNGINEDNFFHKSPSGNLISGNDVSDCRFGVALDSDENARNTTVTNNIIRGCLQSGLDLNKARDAKIEDNLIERCGVESGNSGIWLYGSSAIPAKSVSIIRNTVKNCGGYGIKIGSNVSSVQVVGNRCVGNGKSGIAVIGNCADWDVRKNILADNAGSGVFMNVSARGVLGGK